MQYDRPGNEVVPLQPTRMVELHRQGVINYGRGSSWSGSASGNHGYREASAEIPRYVTRSRAVLSIAVKTLERGRGICRLCAALSSTDPLGIYRAVVMPTGAAGCPIPGQAAAEQKKARRRPWRRRYSAIELTQELRSAARPSMGLMGSHQDPGQR